VTLQEQIRSNRLRTGVVLLGFGFLVAALVVGVAGLYEPGIAGIVGIGAIAYGVFSYFRSGQIIAAASGAHPTTKAEQPELYRAVENAAIGAGLTKTPDVYIIDDVAPNAFAAGRDPQHAYVAATTGLLALLDKRELEGVMAHEIAHVRNRDVRLMSLAAVMVGVIALVSDILMRMTLFGGGRRRDGGLGAIGAVVGIAALILAPIGAALLQMSLSRRREYLADASAAEITGDAEGLASALAKLRDDHHPLKKVTRATAHLYIESPLRDHAGLRSSLGGLFDTHPPLEERIRRLEEAGGFRLAAPRASDESA
jgi:heat shock protein HtpX